ncbi:MAG: CPBP family intramembrane glutamic endopeptidase [Candidatus Methanomethylophilaceae archaeon]
MNEEKKYTFDDLFEKKEQEKIEITKHKFSFKQGLLTIVVYYFVTILLVNLVGLIFYFIPQTSVPISQTSELVDYVKNHDSIGYATHLELDKINNLDGIATVPLDDTYVLILTRDLFSHDAFDGLTSEEITTNVFESESFVLKDRPLKRLVYSDNSEFFTAYDIDISNTDTKIIKSSHALNLLGSNLLNTVMYLMLLVGIGYLSITILKKDWKLLDKKPTKLISMSVIGLGIMFIANLVSSVLASGLSEIFNYTAETSTNQAAIIQMLKSPYMILMVINAVIFAPIVEELVFRKAFFSIIKNKWVALVVSSLMFSLIHIISEPTIGGFIVNLVIYGGSGVGFGYIYLSHKENIYSTIIVHALWNLMTVLLTLIPGLLMIII